MAPSQEPQSLVCNLGAMNPAQRQRHIEICKQLQKAAQEVQVMPDGYAFRYAPDPALFIAAAEFITLESRCCSFYRFILEQEPDAGAIWLRVTGPEEARAFIKAALSP